MLALTQFFFATVAASGTLKLSLRNNFGSQLNAYVTGQDTNGAAVMLAGDGSWYYPDAGGSTTTTKIEANVTLPLQGDVTEFVLPDYITAGRIWVAAGELQFFTVSGSDGKTQIVQPSAVNEDDPSAQINWGFAEMTNTEKGGIYANISFVDWVGLLIGMSLTLGSGTVQTVHGLAKDAVSNICKDMKSQATDGQPWDKMCMNDANGNPLRVLSPNIYLDVNSGTMQNCHNYTTPLNYDDYIGQVWNKYTNQDLNFDAQQGGSNITCRVSNDELSCNDDSRRYAKPSVSDIWGCNTGPFAIASGDNDIHKAVVPRLCAALHRTTLLMNGGDIQPSAQVGAASYYQSSPTNHYSRIVHNYLVDSRGYAFSYDDVNPDGQNEAGVVSGSDPQLLELVVGGPS